MDIINIDLQILADAMGLGKTVMTIALIIARNGRGIPHDSKSFKSTSRDDRRARGGTLIICPMALLSQWKVNIYLSTLSSLK